MGTRRRKWNNQSLPVLQAITDVLKPSSSSSFELDVQVLQAESILCAVYVARIRPEQVHDYRVILHVDGSNSSGKTETVEITKQKVHVHGQNYAQFPSSLNSTYCVTPISRCSRRVTSDAEVIQDLPSPKFSTGSFFGSAHLS